MTTNKQEKTFIVEVKKQDNSTWQGTITWVDGQKKKSFRSVLELIRLMNSAIEEEEKE